MAGERTLPGAGLRGFYTPGTNGWGAQLSEDIRVVSAAMQLSVESMTASLPGSPADGVMYIVPSGGDAEKVAVRDNGAWVYLTPKVGWLAYVRDTGIWAFYNTANNWVELETGGGGAEELDDLTDVDVLAATNGQYLKKVAGVWVGAAQEAAAMPAWPVSVKGANYTLVAADAWSTVAMSKASAGTITVPANSVQAIPIGTEIEVGQTGAGVLSIVAGSGVTIRALSGTLTFPGQYSFGRLRKIATDEWSFVLWGNAGSGGVVASVAEYLAATANRLLDTDTVWDAAAPVPLTDAATVAMDFSTFINATLTLGGNRTLGAPSNMKPGQSGTIEIRQDVTGGRTLAYGSGYVFVDGGEPELATTASALNLLAYTVLSDGSVFISGGKAIAA